MYIRFGNVYVRFEKLTTIKPEGNTKLNPELTKVYVDGIPDIPMMITEFGVGPSVVDWVKEFPEWLGEEYNTNFARVQPLKFDKMYGDGYWVKTSELYLDDKGGEKI